jgi:lauroyl/myristoyl acyltransferase
MIMVGSFLRFHSIRGCERACSPPNLYRLFALIAGLRAAFKKSPAALPLPVVIGAGSVVPGTGKFWRNYYLNCALSAFPDRLAKPEWLNRCSFSGLEELREVQRCGQPAVIMVCHFGPVYLLRLWLQAAGIRAATLVAGQTRERSYMNRLKDRTRLCPEIPTVFYPDQLRAVVKFLAAGNALIIAVDNNSGNQMEIPVDDRFNFQMATGALRLAVRHQARLFPCNIIDEGRWRFRIELGRPVPPEFLSDPPDFKAAGSHLLGEMLPCFRAHPEQCTDMLFNGFQPTVSAGTIKI